MPDNSEWVEHLETLLNGALDIWRVDGIERVQRSNDARRTRDGRETDAEGARARVPGGGSRCGA